jgi:hypothetical protein
MQWYRIQSVNTNASVKMASKIVLLAEPNEGLAGRISKLIGSNGEFEFKIASTEIQAASILNTNDVGLLLLAENISGSLQLARNAHSREVPFVVTYFGGLHQDERDKFNKYRPIEFLEKDACKEIAMIVSANYVRQKMREKRK